MALDRIQEPGGGVPKADWCPAVLGQALGKPIGRRSLRTPQEDGGVIADLPLEQVADLAAENVRRRGQYVYDVQGRSLAELSRQARQELLRDARRSTTAYRDVRPASSDDRGLIFLAGHQPQLPHLGVWFKNFALDWLASRHGAAAVNLQIDNDTAKDATLSAPGGSLADPLVAAIPFDKPSAPMPYEERPILDRQGFADFGRRVAEHIAPLVPNAMIRDYWPLAVGRMRQTDRLGACLAQSRHQWEARWGLQSLEIPQSRVCDAEPFAWLVAHLVVQLPRFWKVHNEVVREYRRAHRIRSASHPVPDLREEDGWLEAPFWIWTRQDPRRRALFARQVGDCVRLSDREGVECDLPLSPEGDAARAVDRLMDLRSGGVKLRTRSLTTTLWARLFLGDLFIHGIGGAKYDQVTDELIERFFGLEPPGFLTLTATLRLPLERPRIGVDEALAIDRRLRELTYHPERYFNGNSSEPAKMAAAKARWIETPQTRENGRERRQAIRRLNAALQPWVAGQREELLRERARIAHALQSERILAWREYAFCLFPEELFRQFLQETLPKSA